MDNVQLREDTGVVWLASSLDPDSALLTTRHSRTLLLINSDGRQWQFEPRESNLTTGCAVWLKPKECSLGSNSGLEEKWFKVVWKCRFNGWLSVYSGEARFYEGQNAMKMGERSFRLVVPLQ